MRIIQVASEMAPIAKVGGLADVIMGLSRELVWQGHEVAVALPRYGVIDFSRLQFQGRVDNFQTYFGNEWHKAHAEHFLLDNSIRVALIDTDWGKWRSKPSIYGQAHDDVSSFLQFSKAVMDWILSLPQSIPDVIHIHDWQTAALAAYVHEAFSQNAHYPKPKVVLTLHNLEYQGRTGFSDLEWGGLNLSFNPEAVAAAKDPQYDCANLLKLGIALADEVTTVSPTYAKEILAPIGGKGLESVIASKGSCFHGILNGLDYSYWNPHIDPFLRQQYQPSDGVESVLNAKEKNREELYSLLGIQDVAKANRPLVSSVTRLVEQKGLHLIESVLENAERYDMDCIILGSAYDQATLDRFRHLDHALRTQKRGAVLLQNSEKIAHLIFAASDIFLVPSLFEPCGLTQIIALKYGTIPLVRRTGGLADTVVDVDYPIVSEYVREPNGFCFNDPDVGGIESALYRALKMYREGKDKWKGLIETAMNLDFSWYRSARQYLQLYKQQ